MKKSIVPPFLFVGAAALGACVAENADTNADGAVDLADAITILGHLFGGKPHELPPLCTTPGRSGPPESGQTMCYDTIGNMIDCRNAEWPGQDGAYATGCPSKARFMDNLDGTVTDTCTGLMWQRGTADIDGDGAITFNHSDYGPDGITWQEALWYCENLRFAGHEDWRLPNARELESIVDYSIDDRFADPHPSVDPMLEAERGRYWTSTSMAHASACACIVGFWSCTHLYHWSKDDECLVRAVRDGCAAKNGDANADGALDLGDAITILGYLFGDKPPRLQPLCGTPPRSGLPDTGQTTCYDAAGGAIDCRSADWPGQDGFHATGCPSRGRYTDNGDGTVTDACTGLMWQKGTADINGDGAITIISPSDYGPDGITWQEALQYCENLEFAGHDDWRLPSVRELESIVDYERLEPCIDPVFAAEALTYWTSTTVVRFAGEWGGPEHAWSVSFWYGSYVYHDPKEDALLVRAVRDAQ